VNSSNTSFIVLAAGKGTRMKSELPKVLHKVCGKSLIERTLAAIAPLAPAEIVVVVGYGAKLVESEIAEIKTRPEFSSLTITTIRQETQNGTGDAARIGLAACAAASEYIAIVPGDVPLLGQAELRLLYNESAVAVRLLSCYLAEPRGFGRIIRNAANHVERIVEEADASESERKVTEINSSVYLLERTFLAQALGALTPANAQGELYLTDVVSQATAEARVVDAVVVKDAQRLAGANTIVELSALEQLQRRRIVESHQLSGVSFEDPQTVYVDEQVQIGADSWIGANSRLYGRTTIGSSVVIEGDCRIVDSEIQSGAVIKLGSYLAESVVGANSAIGPFVQLRPGTVLGAEVKLGNFVEVKNSKLGVGAKANHLAYIGDASVGGGSNIGAGTIFCNYDGVKKHHSQVGENVFIGSNSVVVSPVEIGDSAYIAAGSTITKDVPSGTLGIGRARQTNIEGWVERKRGKQDVKKK
jgi:bifunctional UDP-N-acetylglucosamine pyrophosphorylase/glucosamine-1-phosphate N-acetyltransferase